MISNTEQIQTISEKIIQTLPLPQCRKHLLQFDQVCANEQCPMQWRLVCKECIKESHLNHHTDTLELKTFLIALQNKITQVNSENKMLQDNLENLFIQNSEHLLKLKEKIQFYTDSQNTMQNAFKIIKEQGNNKIRQVENQLNEFVKQASYTGKNSEEEINNRIKAIKNCTAIVKDLKFYELQRIQEQNRSVQNNFRHILTMLDGAINDSNVVQNTFENTSISTSDMIKIKQKNQEEKNISRISEIFPTVKGKAKKRDIINFVNWDSESKELKYQKDNKDKGGEHFYVSFSLSLLNIDQLQEKDFTEDFILNLVDRIKTEAPQIHERKNMERRKMESLGKKRKYCRFHPKIDVDLIHIQKKIKSEDLSSASNQNSTNLISGLLSLPPIQQQSLQLLDTKALENPLAQQNSNALNINLELSAKNFQQQANSAMGAFNPIPTETLLLFQQQQQQQQQAQQQQLIQQQQSLLQSQQAPQQLALQQGGNPLQNVFLNGQNFGINNQLLFGGQLQQQQLQSAAQQQLMGLNPQQQQLLMLLQQQQKMQQAQFTQPIQFKTES